MTGKMCWLNERGKNGSKILHLQLKPGDPWRPYTACRQFAVPDHNIPGGSKGWATYQKLFKAGWTLVPSAEAQHTPALVETLVGRR
jgi:hypothetical protein